MVIEGDDVLVRADHLRTNRRANLFFQGVLGAIPASDGWRCPRRRDEMRRHFLKIHDWLENAGHSVVVAGDASELLDRELERRRSFARTLEAATNLRKGQTTFDFSTVDRSLEAFGWSPARSLRDHQRDGIAHALTAGSAANFSVPGSGKTVIALATAATHLHEGIVDLVVVVGPLSSFRPWELEVGAAVDGKIQAFRIRGSAQARAAKYDQTGRGALLLISYATAAADQLQLLDLFDRFKVMLVVDESHRVKRFRGGVWAPALMELARRARVRMILSGTPMPQSARDLYSQLNILWPDGQLTGGRDQFAAMADRRFQTMIGQIQPFISRTPKEALGLPPYEVVTLEVELSPIQKAVYDLIVDRIRVSVEQVELWKDKLEVLRRARPIRLLQAATNPGLLNKPDEQYHISAVPTSHLSILEKLALYGELETPAKSQVALDLLIDLTASGKKVVVWSNFLGNLDHFAGLVRDRLRLPVFQVDGRVPAGEDSLHAIVEEKDDEVENRESVIARFLEAQEVGVLIANPASCSESISLHRSCKNAIYLDRTYDAALWLQSLDRIHRLGLAPTDQVQVHVLLAANDGAPTIDHLVDASLHAKANRMAMLLEGVNLAPLGLSLDPADDAQGDADDLGTLLRYLQGERP